MKVNFEKANMLIIWKYYRDVSWEILKTMAVTEFSQLFVSLRRFFLVEIFFKKQQNNVDVFCKLHPKSKRSCKAFIFFPSPCPLWISLICLIFIWRLTIKWCQSNLFAFFLPISPTYVTAGLVALSIVAIFLHAKAL